MVTFASEIRGILSQSTFFTVVKYTASDIPAFLSALNPMIQLRRILGGRLPAYRRGQIPEQYYRMHRRALFKPSGLFKMEHYAAICLAYDTWIIDTRRFNSIGEEGSDLNIRERQIQATSMS